MTYRKMLDRAIHIAQLVYVGGVILFGGATLVVTMFPSGAELARCADQARPRPNAIVKSFILGLTWPVSIFVPLVDIDLC